MRLLRSLVAACALAACALLPSTASAAQPASHDPILFVHGWNSSSSTWTTMVNRFAADGWTSAELNNWSYNTSQSNATTAAQLRDKVNAVFAANGNSKVDIITHSQGGLNSRY